jgi:hypothetical protein
VSVPAGTVTVAGTVAAMMLLLVRVTTNPDGPASPDNLIVSVLFVPPFTDVGFKVTAVTAAACTVNVAGFATPRNLPTTCTRAFALTGLVVTVNVAVFCPAGTVTETGTPAIVDVVYN